MGGAASTGGVKLGSIDLMKSLGAVPGSQGHGRGEGGGGGLEEGAGDDGMDAAGANDRAGVNGGEADVDGGNADGGKEAGADRETMQLMQLMRLYVLTPDVSCGSVVFRPRELCARVCVRARARERESACARERE